MAKGAYVGASNVARKVKNIFVGAGGVARKVKKGYVGVNGVAKLFYSAETSVTYTGKYTKGELVVDGVKHVLYTLLTSGTLTIDGPARAWACGGGAGGGVADQGYYNAYFSEGGGGGFTVESEITQGNYTVTIGNGGGSRTSGGDTSIGSALIAHGGGYGERYVTIFNGGSGGGASGLYNGVEWTSRNNVGKGSGKSTIPFGAAMDPHCAGGGGGTAMYDMGSQGTVYCAGGVGGSNGSDGGDLYKGNVYGGKDLDNFSQMGGARGGGKGGKAGSYLQKGEDASFYGSGGGGGGANYYNGAGCNTMSGGSGYQGVAYVLV